MELASKVFLMVLEALLFEVKLGLKNTISRLKQALHFISELCYKHRISLTHKSLQRIPEERIQSQVLIYIRMVSIYSFYGFDFPCWGRGEVWLFLPNQIRTACLRRQVLRSCFFFYATNGHGIFHLFSFQ